MRTAELPALAFCSDCGRHTYWMDGACLRGPHRPVELPQIPVRVTWDPALGRTPDHQSRDVLFTAVQGGITAAPARLGRSPLVLYALLAALSVAGIVAYWLAGR